jgi:hypothetical protein
MKNFLELSARLCVEYYLKKILALIPVICVKLVFTKRRIKAMTCWHCSGNLDLNFEAADLSKLYHCRV